MNQMTNSQLISLALLYLAANISEAEEYLDVQIDEEQLSLLETVFDGISMPIDDLRQPDLFEDRL
jgi:hypothetical protein